jgi:hypothetical protein
MLRQARTRRHESLRMAAAGVMLPLRFLAALERDRPLLVFRSLRQAEPFLAEYARYLALDPSWVVAGFRAAHEPLARRISRLEPPGWREPEPPRREAPPRVGRPSVSVSRSVAAAGAIALAALLIAVWLLRSPATERTPDDPTTGASGASPSASVSPRVSASPSAAPSPQVPAELPGGGTSIFPEHRVVALYGSPGNPILGLLGSGTPADAAEELRALVDGYRDEELREVLPAFHIIASLATRSPGDDGVYRMRLDPEQIRAFVEEARRSGYLVLLDVQPGQSDFLTEVQALEEFLMEPFVGVALDPEWVAAPGAVPGDVVGSVDAQEVNEVVEYLAELVRDNGLPQKLLVVHQFNDGMIIDRIAIDTPPELAVIIDIDGVGPRSVKLSKFDALTDGLDRFAIGIKLYTVREEADLLQPEEVMGLVPRPDLVIYQ